MTAIFTTLINGEAIWISAQRFYREFKSSMARFIRSVACLWRATDAKLNKNCRTIRLETLQNICRDKKICLDYHNRYRITVLYIADSRNIWSIHGEAKKKRDGYQAMVTQSIEISFLIYGSGTVIFVILKISRELRHTVDNFSRIIPLIR